jgi:hypothetical protein
VEATDYRRRRAGVCDRDMFGSQTKETTVTELFEQITHAISISPTLAWSSYVVAAALLRFALAPSRKESLFIAAVAAPYGVIAVIAMQ